jgi:hypothetical protein
MRHGRRPIPWRPTLAAAWLVAALVLAACAVVEAPPGGPLDQTPPHLVSSSPDSGALGVGSLKTLRFRFSEKMDRQPATSWLYFFPDQRIRRTKWHGAIEAEIELEEPLPPDTVVVVEIAGRLNDAHRVPSRTSRRFPVATGDAIPGGSIAGVLVMGDSAVAHGVVELYDLPPDTLEYLDLPLVRRTATDAKGAYVFSWLPVPGGPWLLRAFVDSDGNFRPGDGEAKRLLPDTLSLTAATPAVSAGAVTLFTPDTPGRLLIRPFTNFGAAAPVVFWSQAVGEADTGWAPRPVTRSQANFKVLAARTGGALDDVQPGANRLGAFVDVDGDTAFGAVPRESANTYGLEFTSFLTDPAGDTTGWYLEPHLMISAPSVEPGLDTWFSLPDTVIALVPWPAPPAAALPDSTAAAPADSLAPEEAEQ